LLLHFSLNRFLATIRCQVGRPVAFTLRLQSIT